MRTNTERFTIVAALMAGAPLKAISRHYGIAYQRIREIRRVDYVLREIADCGGAASFIARYGEHDVIEALKQHAENYGWKRSAGELMRKPT